MRAMALPTITIQEILSACILGILNEDLKQRLEAVKNDFYESGKNYFDLAQVAKLFAMTANAQNDGDILVGNVTKGEVKSLYSYYLIDKNKPARVFYDALVASAPSGICPLCGTGFAITLDHYLPKSKFPLLSILPNNLVPACRDCNTGKSNIFAVRAGDQSLHPYFDHDLLISEQWLVAEVIHTAPASVRFSVSAPQGWSAENIQRVQTHFVSLKLALRFAVLAANELASINGILNCYVGLGGPQAVKQYLLSCATTESGRYKNSWKTAMFSALAASDWFCDVGFKS